MFTARPLTVTNTNPVQAGMNDAVARQLQMYLARQEGAKAQYASQREQQSLIKEQLANMLQRPKAERAGEFAQAELATSQAEAPFKQAQTKQTLAGIPLTQMTAELFRKTMPAQESKTVADLISDPLLKRLVQLQQAQKFGLIDPQVMQQAGLGGFMGQPQGAPMPGQAPQMPGQMQQGGLAIQPEQYQAIAQALGKGAQYNPQQMPQQPQMRPGVNPPQVQPGTAPKMFSGDAMQNWAMFGTPLSPYQEQEIKAFGHGLSTKEGTNVTNWNEKQKESAEIVNNSIEATKDLDLFENAYKKLSNFQKGAIGGRNFALSSAAQEADKAGAKLVGAAAKALNPMRPTDRDLVLGQIQTLGRTLNKDAAKTIGNSIRSSLIRSKEAQPFFNAAKKNGIDLQTANELWQQYQEENPLFDSKTGEIFSDNLGKWAPYAAGKVAPSSQSLTPSTNTGQQQKDMSQENIEHTAKLKGLSVPEVKRRLGIK